ncbi:MAG: hypothetical protein LBC68_13270 [Prevotellaceae bacterium]|nr:hypothetical protein [Prevotellaceae bacterium]
MKKILYRYAYNLGLVLFLISAFFACLYTPAIFYPQKNGKVLFIEKDTIHYSVVHRGFQDRRGKLKVYRFRINDVFYIIENHGHDYDELIGKNITFRYGKDIESLLIHGMKTLKEIIYEDKVIFSTNKYFHIFLILSTISVLSLIWMIWVFVIYWKKPSKKRVLKENEEEYFLGSYKIMKSGNKYLLYYVSPLGNRTIKAIEITEEEFLSAKNGKTTLEDFCSIYNLW